MNRLLPVTGSGSLVFSGFLSRALGSNALLAREPDHARFAKLAVELWVTAIGAGFAHLQIVFHTGQLTGVVPGTFAFAHRFIYPVVSEYPRGPSKAVSIWAPCDTAG